jgi:putative NIF3 family GTP cyclohydrolase 1 type 2
MHRTAKEVDMTFPELVEQIRACFGPVRVEDHPTEFGFTDHSAGAIARVGYATNLDPLTVAAAVEADVDALLTHHDAWDFLFELRDQAYARLEETSISHVFVHLPLDAAPFGTSVTLGERIGLEMTASFAEEDGFLCGRAGSYPTPVAFAEEDGFLCGRAGSYPTPVAFAEIVARLRRATGAGLRAWPFGPPNAQTVGITTGGGSLCNLLREAIDLGCDTYVTGESNVYLVQYARNRGVNLIVGTHTHTEFPGVERLSELLAEKTDLAFVPIHEPDIETGNREAI